MLEFGSLSYSDGSADSDGDGVSDFFEYLYGSSMNDPADSGFRFVVSDDLQEGAFAVRWTVKANRRFGEHYRVRVSGDLSRWDALPPEHFTLTEVSSGDKTDVLLEMSRDYGRVVFLKLMAP